VHLKEKVYHQIKQKILDGEYAPAQRLVETSLAEDLGVSRHKIRAALNRLQADDLVEIEPNRGATVKSLELSEVVDIFMAREALEAGVAHLAAERIAAKQIEELAVCLETMRVALETEDFEGYSATNKIFHQIIYQASGNQTLPQLINLLRERLVRFQLRSILIPGRREKSWAEHEAIFEALQKGNALTAEQAARAHVSGIRKAIEQAWKLVGL
jgi:DNA-binding GntR family transcriptional regulator